MKTQRDTTASGGSERIGIGSHESMQLVECPVSVDAEERSIDIV